MAAPVLSVVKYKLKVVVLWQGTCIGTFIMDIRHPSLTGVADKACYRSCGSIFLSGATFCQY